MDEHGCWKEGSRKGRAREEGYQQIRRENGILMRESYEKNLLGGVW